MCGCARACTQMNMLKHSHMCTHLEAKKLALGIFLNLSPPYVLSLSLKPESTIQRDWPINPRDSSISLSPELGLQLQAITPAFTWVLGTKFRFSCLHGQHLTD